MGSSPFQKEYSRSSHKARSLCHLRHYTGSPKNHACLSPAANRWVSYLFGSLAMCRTLESCAVFWQAITRFVWGLYTYKPLPTAANTFWGEGGDSEMGIKLVLNSTWCDWFPALLWHQKATVTFPISSPQFKSLCCPLKSKNIKSQRKALSI